MAAIVTECEYKAVDNCDREIYLHKSGGKIEFV